MGTDACCECDLLAWAESDEDILAFADGLASDILETEKDSGVAESARCLLIACTALLRDWFPRKDFTPCGMTTTLAMALMQGKYDTSVNFSSRESPLDLVFLQIEQGVKYTQDLEGQWGWRKSKFVRNFDGTRPADSGGLPLGKDIASAFYARWRQSAEPKVLERSIYSCISSVARLGLRQ